MTETGAVPKAPTDTSGTLAWVRRHKVLSGLGLVIALAVISSALDSSPPTTPTASTGGSPGPSVLPSAHTTTSAAVATTAATKAPVTAQLIAEALPRSALALLGTLVVKGRAPMTGYSRDAFGQAWADTNRNGCDTRNDVLKRDLTSRTVKTGTGGCVILSGSLADPYTATTVGFVRGGASEVDIDHVVALGNTWVTGATAWEAKKRLAFANDPLNLLVVAAGANRQKGDGDAATWLPSNKAYRCSYVARQVALKAKYGLWVTAPERDAIARVLSACPGQVAPSGGSPTLAPISGSTSSGSTSSPKPAASRTNTPVVTAATYANCTELRKDYPGGVARPGAVNQGGTTYKAPHYSQSLYDANQGKDRDKDGIACEA